MKFKMFIFAVMLGTLLTTTTTYSKAPLNLQKIATIHGYAPGDNFGYPVKDVGDINNDGYPDLAIGYGRYPDCPDTNRVNCHRIDIYYGGATLDTIPDITFWNALNIWGNMDLNGDGHIDLVARYTSFFDFGTIKVFLGSESGPDTIADLSRSGEGFYHQFGREMAAGDINADGYDDLVVAAPFDDIAAYGRVYVFFGGNPLDLEPDWYYQSEEEFASYGESVVCGDMNADGYADFAVGAPFDLAEKPSRIYLYSGGDTLSIIPDYIYEAPNIDSYLGRKIEYVSDWNNSEYGLILAGWLNTEDFNGVLKLSGASEWDRFHPEVIFNTDNPHDQSFFITNAEGYFNNDSEKDILISEGLYKSTRYLCYLGMSDIVNPDTLIVPGNMSNYAYYIGNAIDFNDDGIDEILVIRQSYDDWTVREFLVDIFSNNPFPVSGSAIDKDNGSIQMNGFLLEPIYPNPFNQSTIIQFTLPEASQVQLSVHDVLGREIALLANSIYPSGIHSLRWDAEELPSGIYVVRMTVDDNRISKIRKTVLLK